MLEWTCYTEYGLPSGHSMLGLILMQFVLRFFARSYKCIAKYIGLFYLLILILQLLVMFSRVILGMHSINQVLFGAIIGMYSFIPYYLFVEKWLLNRFVSLFGASKDLPLMTISISIMLTITLELLITLIPVYNIVDYISVINATNGCQKIKQAKSFQYKCFEDSSLLMAAYGTLIGFLFL